MRSLLKSLPLLGLALALALPTAAHARFGKSGGGGNGGGNRSGGNGGYHGGNRGGGNGGAPRGGYHTAGPAGTHYAPYRGGGYGGGYRGYGGYGGYRGYGYSSYGYPSYGYYNDFYAPGYVRYGWGYGYYPLLGGPVTSYVAADGRETSMAPQAPPVTVTVGADGQVVRQNGGSLGVRLGIEGQRWGFSGDLHSLFVGTDDGTRGTDAIHLLNAHLTYALLSGPHGRLRVEGGVDSAFAPEATFLGPGVAVSGVIGLLGPVSLEAKVGYVPFPFTEVDWNAGLVVALGPVGIRGGWRSTYLNDQGRVDGVVHEDLFDGPYVGLSMAF